MNEMNEMNEMTEYDKQVARALEFCALRDAREAKERADARARIEELAITNGRGFALRDVNNQFNNIGHYPEWVVDAASADSRQTFATYDEAAAAAVVKNNKSASAWRRALDGV